MSGTGSGRFPGASVVLYGCSPPDIDITPNPGTVGTEIPNPWATIAIPAPLTPCPKCKRHVRENECPFCYADSLKPEAVKDLAGAVERAGFRLSPDAAGEPTLWCVECGRDTGFHFAKCSKHNDMHERDTAIRERDTLQRRYDGLVRDITKLLADHAAVSR